MLVEKNKKRRLICRKNFTPTNTVVSDGNEFQK